ncbi:MAG: AbrB/MazE/SpoVT family DNA-binding domain-containing protein [Chloroflexi bacterium]|nr:AbrB/MazE/SpoVT family DNA-binding domain-containing protein [Chloroflexota bacterium]
MGTVLKARIVKIGNSRGIRIPKVWLDQLALGEEVEMAVQSDQIVIRPARRPRHNWEEQFRALAAQGDDRLLDEAIATRWDKEEWEW